MRSTILVAVLIVIALAASLRLAGAETYQYDAAGRLLSVEYDSGEKLSYTYDAGGNLIVRSVEDATAGDGVPASSLAEVWVDFAHAGSELGTQANPFDTAIEGTTAVTANGTVHLSPGTSSETLTLLKPMTLESTGGVVRIGFSG